MTRRETALSHVLELSLLLSTDAAEGLADRGLTVSRAHVVWELQHRGPCTQRELADAVNVTPRTMTTLIDALEQTGFLTREPHPTDRRASLVTFTPRGRGAGQALVDDYQHLARTLFHGLPAGELERFDATLAHVIGRLREVRARRS
jgi:DNA-binding MarR family transcriptional regulator